MFEFKMEQIIAKMKNLINTHMFHVRIKHRVIKNELEC